RIVPPVLLSQTPPRYPPLAQQRGIDGVVELTALVDETGHVVEVRVTRAQPARLGFEEAAVQHVRTRRYRPATRDGTPIRMVVPIVVKFTKAAR
ncbi:MAG TPA: energy transducer TonB, partial [Vicinamibacteria bacterium]|nr:energy transducer TonB [Vicinamibacteria bacterium]